MGFTRGAVGARPRENPLNSSMSRTARASETGRAQNMNCPANMRPMRPQTGKLDLLSVLADLFERTQ